MGTINSLSKKENKIICVCMVLLDYLDHITYERCLKFLVLNYDFAPAIIHTDFEKSMSLAIKKVFGSKILHSRCFFHFSQMIRAKLQKIGYSEKKLNKNNSELIRNIEMLCFIRPEKIKNFQKIIITYYI